LTTLVEDVAELLSTRAHAKGLEIASFVDEDLPARVVGDATRVRQVLLNLAGNAVKFTDAGGLAIIVSRGHATHDIAFAVRDTGIGIAEDAQARIFGEFEQADSAATRRFGGTGLGLAISKRIVERMGGRITVSSRPGRGSTFTAVIPLPGAADAEPATVPDLGGRAILVVGASRFEAPLAAERLARWSAEITLAPDANTAVAKLSGRRSDTIVVDRALGLPETERVARAAGEKVGHRIVLVTPDQRGELAGLQAAGYSGYLIKPVRLASLAARFDAADQFDGAPVKT